MAVGCARGSLSFVGDRRGNHSDRIAPTNAQINVLIVAIIYNAWYNIKILLTTKAQRTPREN